MLLVLVYVSFISGTTSSNVVRLLFGHSQSRLRNDVRIVWWGARSYYPIRVDVACATSSC